MYLHDTIQDELEKLLIEQKYNLKCKPEESAGQCRKRLQLQRQQLLKQPQIKPAAAPEMPEAAGTADLLAVIDNRWENFKVKPNLMKWDGIRWAKVNEDALKGISRQHLKPKNQEALTYLKSLITKGVINEKQQCQSGFFWNGKKCVNVAPKTIGKWDPERVDLEAAAIYDRHVGPKNFIVSTAVDPRAPEYEKEPTHKLIHRSDFPEYIPVEKALKLARMHLVRLDLETFRDNIIRIVNKYSSDDKLKTFIKKNYKEVPVTARTHGYGSAVFGHSAEEESDNISGFKPEDPGHLKLSRVPIRTRPDDDSAPSHGTAGPKGQNMAISQADIEFCVGVLSYVDITMVKPKAKKGKKESVPSFKTKDFIACVNFLKKVCMPLLLATTFVHECWHVIDKVENITFKKWNPLGRGWQNNLTEVFAVKKTNEFLEPAIKQLRTSISLIRWSTDTSKPGQNIRAREFALGQILVALERRLNVSGPNYSKRHQKLADEAMGWVKKRSKFLFLGAANIVLLLSEDETLDGNINMEPVGDSKFKISKNQTGDINIGAPNSPFHYVIDADAPIHVIIAEWLAHIDLKGGAPGELIRSALAIGDEKLEKQARELRILKRRSDAYELRGMEFWPTSKGRHLITYPSSAAMSIQNMYENLKFIAKLDFRKPEEI